MDRTFYICSPPSAFSASEGHISPIHMASRLPTYLAGLVQRVSGTREWYRFPSKQLSIGLGMHLSGNARVRFPGSVPPTAKRNKLEQSK